MMRPVGVYIISVAAELSGVHPQTLRTYERRGLINPSRTNGGTRRYSQRDVDRVKLIQELTQGEGINLAGVLRILAMQDRIEELEEQVQEATEAAMFARRAAAKQIHEHQTRATNDIVLWDRGNVEIMKRRRGY